MDLFAVLLTGLLAGGVSCAAVQGGLLAGMISRQRRSTDRESALGGTRLQSRSAPGRLADDLAPVGGFLIGKLVSHAILGALLGALGSVAQLSIGLRTWIQLLAGVVIIAFGLVRKAPLAVPLVNLSCLARPLQPQPWCGRCWP